MSDIQVWARHSDTYGSYYFFKEKGGRLEGVLVQVDKEEDPWLVTHVDVWEEGNIQFMLGHIQAAYTKVDNLVGSPLLKVVDQILEKLDQELERE